MEYGERLQSLSRFVASHEVHPNPDTFSTLLKRRFRKWRRSVELETRQQLNMYVYIIGIYNIFNSCRLIPFYVCLF